jgi:hypothetical protein
MTWIRAIVSSASGARLELKATTASDSRQSHVPGGDAVASVSFEMTEERADPVFVDSSEVEGVGSLPGAGRQEALGRAARYRGRRERLPGTRLSDR